MDAVIYNKIETEAQRIIDAAASCGAVIIIGEDVVASGDNKGRLRVDLPSNWSDLYDVVIGVAAVGSASGDWIYAPFSSTGTPGGTFITNTSGVIYHTTLTVVKDNNDFYYKGMEQSGSVITPSTEDYLTLRMYSSGKYFLEGCYLKVYGFKSNT